MKNNFLKWNIRIHTMLYSISLFFAGTQIQRASTFNQDLFPEIYRISIMCLLPPLTFWIFRKIAMRLQRERSCAKEHFWMGIAVLVFGGPLWPYLIYRSTPSFLYSFVSSLSYNKAISAYSRVATVFSILTAVFYFVCALIAHKERKEEQN